MAEHWTSLSARCIKFYETYCIANLTKLAHLQELFPPDLPARESFVLEFHARMEVDKECLWKILWTDEAHFHLTGYVNTQNYPIWAAENPLGNQQNFNLLQKMVDSILSMFCISLTKFKNQSDGCFLWDFLALGQLKSNMTAAFYAIFGLRTVKNRFFPFVVACAELRVV